MGKSIKNRPLLISLLIAVALTGLFLLVFSPAAVSKWPNPQPMTIAKDIDGNLLAQTYILDKNGKAKITEAGETLWESPPEWTITQIAIADITNDGKPEFLMVLWKTGSFGKDKPLWFEGTDEEYTNHLFLYRLVDGRMKPVWCSSALHNPIIRLSVEYDNDGCSRLQILEGPAKGPLYSLRRFMSHSPSLWQWDEWGFKRTHGDGPFVL